MGEAQKTEVAVGPKVYFYYPAFNEKFVRRTLAGVVEDGILHVAQAAVFPGYKAKIVPVKFRSGQVIHVVDPGMKADNFNKKEGRRIATERATGIKHLAEGKTARVGRKTIFQVPVPAGDYNPGKFFVSNVEVYLQKKGFPARVPKEKKDAPEPGAPKG